MKNEQHDPSQPSTNAEALPEPASVEAEKTLIGFAEELVDAMETRRRKTAGVISDEQLNGIFDECLRLRELGDIAQAVETLGRLMDSGHFLAVAGNWPDFLELFGWTREDWNRAQGRSVNGP